MNPPQDPAPGVTHPVSRVTPPPRPLPWVHTSIGSMLTALKYQHLGSHVKILLVDTAHTPHLGSHVHSLQGDYTLPGSQVHIHLGDTVPEPVCVVTHPQSPWRDHLQTMYLGSYDHSAQCDISSQSLNLGLPIHSLEGETLPNQTPEVTCPQSPE